MAVKKTNQAPVDPMFGEMLAELKSAQGVGGGVQYLKQGDTTIKLVIPEGRQLRNFYVAYDDVDQKGQRRTSYLIAAVIVEADDNSVVNEEAVRYIKVTATTLEHIITHLQNRWPLFEDNGPVFTITKLSAKPWYRGIGVLNSEFDASEAKHPEQTIEEAAQAEAERSAEKVATSAAVSGGKKFSKGSGEDLPF